MKNDFIFSRNRQTKKKPESLWDYIKLCFPILLFPLLYLPYTLWWRRGFTALATRLIRGSEIRVLQLMLTGNNTILFFWGLVTILVMLASIVVSVLRIRPWYAIPLYLAVMFSMCGIFSLLFYTAITRYSQSI